MSSDALARVEAFAQKADKLFSKGHVVRAAENYGRAAEAARELGEDNLVAVGMQLGRSAMLCAHAAVAGQDAEADCRVLAGYRAEGIQLLPGAMEALERRRVAGTLLAGKCAAVEEVWQTHEIQRENAHLPAAMAASWAALVGYEMFLRAATNVVLVLARPDLHAAEFNDSQFQSFTQHVVQAAALMQQPRRHGDVNMQIEAAFTKELRDTVAEAAAYGLDARLVRSWRARCSGCSAAACCRRAASRSASGCKRPSSRHIKRRCTKA